MLQETITDLEMMTQENRAPAVVLDLPKEKDTTPVRYSGPGYIKFWDLRTGEELHTTEDLWKGHPPSLGVKDRKDEAGQLIFSEIKPDMDYVTGKWRCWLHPEGEERAHYDAQGFPVCSKATLINPMQVQMHMKRKHATVWEAILFEKTEKADKELRELQIAVLKQQLPPAPPVAPLTITEEQVILPKLAELEVAVRVPRKKKGGFKCECGQIIKHRTQTHIKGERHQAWGKTAVAELEAKNADS